MSKEFTKSKLFHPQCLARLWQWKAQNVRRQNGQGHRVPWTTGCHGPLGAIGTVGCYRGHRVPKEDWKTFLPHFRTCTNLSTVKIILRWRTRRSRTWRSCSEPRTGPWCATTSCGWSTPPSTPTRRRPSTRWSWSSAAWNKVSVRLMGTTFF